MPQQSPLFLDTGSIEKVAGNRIIDLIHFPVTQSISSSYTTLLPDPYLFATMSANITNAVNTTSSSLFELSLPNRQENYFYPHNSIVGVSTSATATGVRIGLQSQNNADSIASIKVASTLTAHTIANIGTQSPTTFALPASMAAITTVYPAFVKGLYNNSSASVPLKNTILLQPETNNTVTAHSGSVSYNKFVGYNFNLLDSTTFTIGTGFNNLVYVVRVQEDGKILVGGDFTDYNGTTQNRITRLNSDGTRDTSFTIGTGFDIFNALTIAIQQDGKIIVGGNFTSYNGTTQNRITRLNSDGTRDTSFTIGTGFNGGVNSLAIQEDGKILVGGDFTDYNGTTQNRITRLNSDGTRDTSFSIGTGFNLVTDVIAIQQDGKILVGGQFTDYNGTTQRKITRLNSDGTRDTSFTIGTGFDVGSGVNSIAIQEDGKIIVGGNYTSYNGTTQNYITRLNSDGTRDTSFTIGTGFDVTVYALKVQKDGKILVGGQFTDYNGTNQNGITRLNSDGTRDTSFSIGTGFNGSTFSLLIQQDGKIVIGGNFTNYNGTTQNRITRLRDNTKEKSIPLHLSTGSLKLISGSDTISASYLPVTSSLWLSQSLATNVANTSATAYATVFTLTGLTTNKRYLANLYLIGQSAAAATGFRMRVATGSEYRGTLYTPTSTTAPAIQNSANGANITSVAAATWPTVNTKYLVFGEYTFIKAATDPRVEIISETAGTAVTAFSGSVIFYRPID